MSIGEADAFAGEPVEVRRGDFGIGIEAADVAVAEIIGEDKDDVGAGGVRGGRGRKRGSDKERESESNDGSTHEIGGRWREHGRTRIHTGAHKHRGDYG